MARSKWLLLMAGRMCQWCRSKLLLAVVGRMRRMHFWFRPVAKEPAREKPYRDPYMESGKSGASLPLCFQAGNEGSLARVAKAEKKVLGSGWCHFVIRGCCVLVG